MGKFILFIIKFTFLSALVLVLGNLISVRGKTISDQVKFHLSGIQNLPVTERVESWSKTMFQDLKNGINTKTASLKESVIKETISRTEKEKLRSLIQELNSSTRK